ncbi:MAG: histidine phosphotransferase family protein [Pseudomonadota bacterium]
MSPHDLSALVSSRICHDLISPIGAISNGVELMQDLGGKASPELGLIGDSVNSASAKLRYYRIAFGATPASTRIQMSELRLVTEAMFSGRTRAEVLTAPADLPRTTAKLLLLALLCVEKCLPMGGHMKLDVHEDHFDIVVNADRLKPLVTQWAILEGEFPEEPPVASDVQFFLLGNTLTATGAVLQRTFSEDRAEVAVCAISP